MGFWTRLFHSDDPAPLKLRDLKLRLDDVEAEVEHLHSQLKKLRGRVTGGIRQDAPETAPETPEAPISPEAQSHAQEIENGRLLVAMRGQRGLLRG
jgi:hypothetical protein